jgi:hypothetical protein
LFVHVTGAPKRIGNAVTEALKVGASVISWTTERKRGYQIARAHREIPAPKNIRKANFWSWIKSFRITGKHIPSGVMHNHTIEILLGQRNIGLSAAKKNRDEVIVLQHAFSNAALVAVALSARSICFGLTDRQRFAIAFHFDMHCQPFAFGVFQKEKRVNLH